LEISLKCFAISRVCFKIFTYVILNRTSSLRYFLVTYSLNRRAMRPSIKWTSSAI